MKIFGIQLGRVKDAVQAMGVNTWMGGWLHETFAGAWQSNVTVDSREKQLAYGAVYSCITFKARDVGKLRPRLMRYSETDKVWQEDIDNTSHALVLRKPNRFQTINQFINNWQISKLIAGNTYVLKERDDRGIVRALYILDPKRCLPLVAPDGAVYYQVGSDNLAGVKDDLPAIPASEIIHDRAACLFHPLVGISPLYACGMSATQGNKIQGNSAKFFENMSRPSGQLTAPGTISNETAARLKADFETKFSGPNIGRLLVAGDGLKFESFTMPAEAAQLIEQLRWTVEDIARCFQMPLYKIGAGQMPQINNVAALNLEYYQQCLQPDIEDMESLLDEGLELKNQQCVEFDIDNLIRMDGKTRAETDEIRVRSATLTPNESRRNWNLVPKKGGDALYLQQQNYSLEALAKRDAGDDPFGKQAPAPAAPAAANDDDVSAEEAAAAKVYLGKKAAEVLCAQA